jgi:hypothetical protein
MRRATTVALLLVLGGYAYAFGQASQKSEMPSQKPSSPVFDRIKALAGEWEGKASGGMAVRESYRVVSNGSAVMNVVDPGGEHEMITMFHMDGQNVMVTHYCAAGNQPRMVTKPGAKPNTIEFAFKDVTNITQPGEGHMSGLVLTIDDADHHRQEWMFRQGGKDMHDVFDLVRKK